MTDAIEYIKGRIAECQNPDYMVPVHMQALDEVLARVAELNAHIEGINTVVGAAQELINNAEWDGDISTVDTGDLKALQSALLEPLRG